ncbi:MAG: hypothetical protein HYV37_01100 [Candidatus Levyibacteriota bacterium]|nr:MAG: hypothetical protein HYV37_01100 [Candidatus Levybacteria bacterium]
MIDTAQAVFLFVILVLTILVLVLGVQVFFILRELRQTVSKANKVLDDAGLITESVSGPLTSLSSLATGVKTGALLAGLLRRKKKDKNNE